jgi:phage tail-like protein
VAAPADSNGHAAADGNGNGHPTLAGAGFGTLVARLAPGMDEAPPVTSRRATLRNELPALYQEGDFGMRFIGALELVLDPIEAVLDSLTAHFDPDYAPHDVLQLLAAWLGIQLDESQELQHQREIVRRAGELGRRRGTVRGMELALELYFPGIPLRVEDRGGVRWSLDHEQAKAPPPSFVVYCDEPVPEETQAAIARCIEQFRPVHTTYRLRVKTPK